MPPLTDPALEAILKDWNPEKYDPPNTDVRKWTSTLASLCETYGIPDTQRPQCAVKFVKGGLRNEFEKVLADARNQFGPVHWAQFQDFMNAWDRTFREKWDELPFYKKHPKFTGTAGVALGIIGTVLLAPVAVVGVLSVVGFTSEGVAAGSIAATIQSIVYGGATGGLFSLLQSAGATMIIPSVGAIFAGAATAGAGVGIAVMNSGSGTPGEPLSNSIVGGLSGNNGDNDDDDGYLFTPQAIKAIVKSWDVAAYNLPGTRAARWLVRVQKLCEVYGVPVKQQALIAMHHMGADCREAAHTAGCYDMKWDQFQTWLRQYDDANRPTAIGRIAAGLLAESGKS